MLNHLIEGSLNDPHIQQFLQIPLVLGLTFALWRPAGLLLRRSS